MREARVAAATRRVRLQLGRAAAAEQAARLLDRAADRRVALGVQRGDTLLPVRCRLGAVGKERARGRGVARHHLDHLLERRVPELGEPEAVLLDQVDGEPVAARRDRPAQAHLLPQRLARRDRRARAASVSPSQTIGLPRSSSQW